MADADNVIINVDTHPNSRIKSFMMTWNKLKTMLLELQRSCGGDGGWCRQFSDIPRRREQIKYWCNIIAGKVGDGIIMDNVVRDNSTESALKCRYRLNANVIARIRYCMANRKVKAMMVDGNRHHKERAYHNVDRRAMKCGLQQKT